MNDDRADDLWLQAFDYVMATAVSEVERAEAMAPDHFTSISSTEFLEHYVWVVFASGFKASIVLDRFEALRHASKDFDLDRMARKKSINSMLAVFNNERKCQNVIDGAKLIYREGFLAFRSRVALEGVDALVALPGIGPITKDHLAKNVGLADVEKNDIWIERAAAWCDTTPVELIDRYAAATGLKRHTTDIILWIYLAGTRGGVLRQQASNDDPSAS